MFRLIRYSDLKKGDRLKELQEKNSRSQTELESCDTRKKEISAELVKSKDLMQNQDQLRRKIDDNLNYRKTKAEVDELAHEIKTLEENILKAGGISTIETERQKLSQERERLLSEVFQIPEAHVYGCNRSQVANYHFYDHIFDIPSSVEMTHFSLWLYICTLMTGKPVPWNNVCLPKQYFQK